MSGTLHAFEYWLMQYRRVWHGSVFSNFVMPIMFLVSIGYGVGEYVHNTSVLGGMDYATFVAAGLMGSTALQIASGEMTWPVFAALRWGHQYKAMQASPLSPEQMLAGHLLYALMRVFIASVAFFIVMGAFGLLSAGTAPLTILAGFGVGFAVIGWIYAYAISVKQEVYLSIVNRFVIVPVTLFSGVFFPLSQLPAVLQPIAWISPVWHGAELSRWAVTGIAAPWPWAAHLGYLILVGAVGWWVAGVRLRRRLSI